MQWSQNSNKALEVDIKLVNNIQLNGSASNKEKKQWWKQNNIKSKSFATVLPIFRSRFSYTLSYKKAFQQNVLGQDTIEGLWEKANGGYQWKYWKSVSIIEKTTQETILHDKMDWLLALHLLTVLFEKAWDVTHIKCNLGTSHKKKCLNIPHWFIRWYQNTASVPCITIDYWDTTLFSMNPSANSRNVQEHASRSK